MHLCTRIERTDFEGDKIECDAVVYFSVASYQRGYAATYWQPAEGPYYEFNFDGAELDGIPDDAPGPLTATEMSSLRAWFDAHYDEACDEAANDNHDDGQDPDEMRDRARDYANDNARFGDCA